MLRTRFREEKADIKEDLRELLSDLSGTIRDAQAKLIGGMERQKMRVRDYTPRTSKTPQNLRRAYDNIKHGGYRAVEGTRDKVEQRPLTLVLGALVAGVVVGRFLMRR